MPIVDPQPRRHRRPATTPAGQAGQLQPSRPALRAFPHSSGLVRAQICSRHGRQQRRRLVAGQRQLGRAKLGQLTPGAHPGDRQRWIGATGNHQPQGRRQISDQELDTLVDPGVTEHVEVVEHQDMFGARRRQFVEQQGQRQVDRIDAGHLQCIERRGTDRVVDTVQCREHVAPEPVRLVVGLVE